MLLGVTLTCILAVIVTTAVTARSGLATTEETILEDTRTLAKVLGEASIGAITFNDSGTVESSLRAMGIIDRVRNAVRSEEHTSELQSRGHLVCRLLLEKKKRYSR